MATVTAPPLTENVASGMVPSDTVFLVPVAVPELNQPGVPALNVDGIDKLLVTG